MASEKVAFGGEHIPTEAITTDFEKLLTKFTNTKSVRYEWFLQVWNEMSMPLFYAGRQNDRECREFTEECLHLASAYVLPPYQFQVRVCGLYLLYALYFRHPFEPRVKIRVTLSEWKEILTFIDEIRQQQHLDVDYVFTKLRHDKAFHFVVAKTELYPGVRGGSDAVSDAQQHRVDVMVEQTSAISNIFQPDAIEELSTIHEEYHRHKCFLAGVDATQPDPSFNIINAGLVHDITKAVASHETWRKSKSGRKGGRRRRDSGHTNSESEGESEGEQGIAMTPKTSSVGMSRAEIKARAFSSAATVTQSRRHRQAHVVHVTDRVSRTTPRKRGRKSRGSGKQDDLSHSEMISSPRNDGEGNCKEALTFGGLSFSQPDKNGILSMPNLLGDESPKKQNTKRTKSKSPSSAKRKTPKEKLEKIKKSEKKKLKRDLDKTDQPSSEATPGQAKKRGRPRKDPTLGEVNGPTPGEINGPTPGEVKKRGRPRKFPITTPQASAEEMPDASDSKVVDGPRKIKTV